MKYETPESNELIGVKLPPQEDCEANMSSVSATSEYRMTQSYCTVLYCTYYMQYTM